MMETSHPLSEEQRAAWSAHCLAEFPKEACAYIAGGNIFPVPNISPNPTETFAVHPIERMKAEAEGKITGFLHSHPATPRQAAERPWPVFWPSSHDMRGWLGDDVRWGISACDGEVVADPVWLDEDYIAPLEGRPFLHGIWDCYSAVRDWFRVKYDITLKNYPRGMDWWHTDDDLYMTQFREAGFVEIKAEEARPGDCVMMAIHSKGKLCHAAVIVDSANMYHHAFSRTGDALSGITSLGRWNKFIMKYVRYTGENQSQGQNTA
jgi:cell wall-associated NlpC family hydrolase